MAVGLMGYPLHRGNSEEIKTCIIKSGSTKPASAAGLAVVRTGKLVDGMEEVDYIDSTNAVAMEFAGFLSSDITTSHGKTIVGVICKGLDIPVQVSAHKVATAIDQCGIGNDGKLIAGSHADARFLLNADVISTDEDAALDENGHAIPCQRVNLYSAGSVAKP